MRNCLIWTFVGMAIAGGRAHRFSDHAHFNVRIHDGLKTGTNYRMGFDVAFDLLFNNVECVCLLGEWSSPVRLRTPRPMPKKVLNCQGPTHYRFLLRSNVDMFFHSAT